MKKKDLRVGTSSCNSHRHENWIPAANVSAWTLAAITLVGAFLRLRSLTAKPIWYDEALSFVIARLPWTTFFRTLWRKEANASLYFLLLHLWISMGTSLGVMRALSVLFSVATIPVIYLLGARLFGRTVGLLAAWLLAINAFDIRYAQEARSYAMLVFFVAVATWLFVRNLQEPESARWNAYAGACALILYSHFLGAIVIAIHFLSLTFLPRKDVPWRDIVRSYVWFAFWISPLVVFALKTRTRTVQWVPPMTAGTLGEFWKMLSGNYGWSLASLVGICILVVIFGMHRAPRSSDSSHENWNAVLVLALLFIPILAITAISLVHPLFVPRYLTMCLPAFALALAAGLTRIRPLPLTWLLCASISVLSILGTREYYRADFDTARYDWSSVASYVFEHAQPGDGVFFYDQGGETLFEFYRAQQNPAPLWPETLNPAHQEDLKYKLPSDAPPLPELIGTHPARDRVWLVLLLPVDPSGKPNTEGSALRDWFAKGRHRIDVQRYPPIGVLLYARDGANATQTTAVNP